MTDVSLPKPTPPTPPVPSAGSGTTPPPPSLPQVPPAGIATSSPAPVSPSQNPQVNAQSASGAIPTPPPLAGSVPPPPPASSPNMNAGIPSPLAQAPKPVAPNGQGASNLPPVESPLPPLSGAKPGQVGSSTLPSSTVPGAQSTQQTTASQEKNQSGPKKAQAPGGFLKNMLAGPKKWIALGLGVILLLLVVGGILASFFGGSSTPTSVSTTGTTGSTGNGSSGAGTPSSTGSTGTSGSGTGSQTILTYWGLWEEEAILEELFDEFSQENPGTIVQYRKQSYREYRERLQSSIASGTGPDLFRYHASWVPMLRAELEPLPTSVMRPSEYAERFYPVAVQQLQSGGQLVGIPLMYDGLGLYYNEDALAAANLQPPQTWSDLVTMASALTIKGENGIERAGIAMGTAENVDHFSDILGLLMLQNGADLTNPTDQAAADALTFYTNFSARDGVWNDSLPNSTVAFARGDAAMMFAPSWRAHEVQALNPDLNFKITTTPTLAGNDTTWANYWAEGVNNKSNNAQLAWELLEFLSRPENQQRLYQAAAQTRAFGAPYSDQSLASRLVSDPYVGPYVQMAPTATSWYLNSATHDNGINDQIISYYKDAVNAVLGGSDPATELETVDLGTTQVLRQFNVSVSGN